MLLTLLKKWICMNKLKKITLSFFLFLTGIFYQQQYKRKRKIETLGCEFLSLELVACVILKLKSVLPTQVTFTTCAFLLVVL